MKIVTREDAIELRRKFDAYTETAEQHEFVLLFIIDRMMTDTIQQCDKHEYWSDIEIQKQLRAMFRVVGDIIGLDTSEYKEDPNEQTE